MRINSNYYKRNKLPTFLKPRKAIVVDAEKFLEITNIHTDNIERIEFETPRIGKGNFGTFRVTFKNEILTES